MVAFVQLLTSSVHNFTATQSTSGEGREHHTLSYNGAAIITVTDRNLRCWRVVLHQAQLIST
jgi:hypothetical protein